MIKQITGRITKKVKKDNEQAARHELMEELFQDFNRSRLQVYRMNFIRGIFFGLGTVIGGTIVVTLLISLLSNFVDWFPYIGEYLKLAIESMRAGK